MTGDAYAIAMLARVVASLLDPLLLILVALVALAFTFQGARKLAVIGTVVVSTVIGLTFAQVRYGSQRASNSTVVDENFQVWPGIAGTKYEEDWNYFVTVRSEHGLQEMKARLDALARDCALLVGPGIQLVKRCERQGTVAAAIAGSIQGLVLALIGLRLRRPKPIAP